MKLLFVGIGISALTALAAIVFLPASDTPRTQSDPDVVGVNIHWHPQLRILVKGQEVAIPQGIGLGATENPIHTHEDVPLIHLEFQGVVRKQDVTLGQFFKAWGKDIRSFGSNMRMTINGQPNLEYENYVMHDGDKIELQYD